MSTESPSPAAPSRRPTIAVPGGRARLLAEIVEPGGGEAGDIVAQALERDDGVRLLRIGYRRSGVVVRSPVSAGARTWRRLLRRAGADPVLGPLMGVEPAAAAGRRRA